MDIYCPRCGEPWDNDELHEVAAEFDATYVEIVATFKRYGCAAMQGYPARLPTCEVVQDGRTALVGAAMELSDDAGDWAADLDGWLQ
jgi:hypothetical protein